MNLSIRPNEKISRLLKNGHLLRFPHPSSSRRTAKYASLLRISGALHLALFEQTGKDDFFSSLLMVVGMIMGKVIITETDSPPPIRITPPWIIIIVRVGMVIIFRPKIDLFARNNGISIIHFTERLGLLSLNVPCDGDLFSSPEDIGV
jgi:hypothetical protein